MCVAIAEAIPTVKAKPIFTDYGDRYIIIFEECKPHASLHHSLCIGRDVQYSIDGKAYVDMVLLTETQFIAALNPNTSTMNVRRWLMKVENVNNPIDVLSEVFTMLEAEHYVPYEKTKWDYAPLNFIEKVGTTTWTKSVKDFEVYKRIIFQ